MATNFGRSLAVGANSTYLTILYNTISRGYRVYGTFVATVVIQIKRPDQSDVAANWSTIKTITSPEGGIIDLVGSWDVRIGTSAYTSGTVEIEIS